MSLHPTSYIGAGIQTRGPKLALSPFSQPPSKGSLEGGKKAWGARLTDSAVEGMTSLNAL